MKELYLQLISKEAEKTFKMFSLSHLAPLLIFIVILFFMLKNRKWIKKCKNYIRGFLLLGVIMQQIMLYSYYVTNGNFDIKDGLPLYLCRIASILCIAVLISNNIKIFDVLYFIGLTGATLALISPDTSGYDFPHIMYIQFFMGHICIFLTVMYGIIVLEFRPTFNSFLKSFVFMIIYLLSAYIANLILDANYCYLKEKPPVGGLLDVLPPYPYYILITFSFIVVVFFIEYLLLKKKEPKRYRLLSADIWQQNEF